MVLSKKGITKALIRLCGCAGWSAPLLFPNIERQVFLHRGPIVNISLPINFNICFGCSKENEIALTHMSVLGAQKNRLIEMISLSTNYI